MAREGSASSIQGRPPCAAAASAHPSTPPRHGKKRPLPRSAPASAPQSVSRQSISKLLPTAISESPSSAPAGSAMPGPAAYATANTHSAQSESPSETTPTRQAMPPRQSTHSSNRQQSLSS